MPKKKCCSSDDYVVVTCDESSSISSFYVDASDYSGDTCDTIKCSSGCSSSSRCGTSSKCSCSSSSDCSGCKYCSSSSGCYDSGYDDGRCHQPVYAQVPAHRPTVPTVPTVLATVPTSMGESQTSSTAEATETVMMLPPSAIPPPRNKSFRAVVTPVIDLRTKYSPNNGTVAFTMRRKNDVVTLQHEPFSGTISQTGATHIAVRQSIGDLPRHPVRFPFAYKLRGEGRIGFIEIDPFDASANIKFFLDPDDSKTANAKDSFETQGNSVSWVASY